MKPDPAPAAEVHEPPVEDCSDALRQRFPALFVGAPKPLKLRIQADIRERAPGVFSKASLSAFLRRHTGRTAYLIALTRASHRFDLDGAPVDPISAEHRQAALDELARRRALRESREAVLEQQRRNRAELLRAFEGSSISSANFCALKGVPVEELDAILALARREAEERSRLAPMPERARATRLQPQPRARQR
jgi:ProP effector